MKKVTKLLSIVLTLVMLVSTLPVIAGATAADNTAVHPNYDVTLYNETFETVTSTTALGTVPVKGWVITAANGKTEADTTWPNSGFTTAADAGLPDAAAHGKVFRLENVAATDTTSTYNTYWRMLNGADNTWTKNYLKDKLGMVQRGCFSFDIFVPADDAGTVLSVTPRAIATYDSASDTLVKSEKYKPLMQLQTDNGDAIVLFDGNAYATYGNIARDQWNNVKIYYDTIYGSADVFINDVQIAAGLSLDTTFAGRAIDCFYFDGGSRSNSWKVYLDNVKATVASPYNEVLAKVDFENYTKADGTALADGDVLLSVSTTGGTVTSADGFIQVKNVAASGTNYVNDTAASVVYLSSIDSNVLKIDYVNVPEYVKITKNAFANTNKYYAETGSFPSKLKLEFKAYQISSRLYWGINTALGNTGSPILGVNGAGAYYTSKSATEGVSTSSSGTVTSNNAKWSKYTMCFDFETGKYDFYQDDKYLGTHIIGNNTTGFEGLTFTGTAYGGNGDGRWYIDDITLSVPHVYADENIHEYIEYTHDASTGALNGVAHKIGFLTTREEGAADENFTIIAAAYNQAGQLIDVSIKDDCTISGTGTGVYEVTLPEGSAAKNCKYFFWKDATTSLSPIFAPKALVK